MHRSLAPEHRRLNDGLGALALFLYGGFLWNELRRGHFAHHAHPVTPDDPDYAPDEQERFFPWLWRFVSGYYSWKNLALMHIHVLAAWAVSGSIVKVLVFFAVPAWLSALQLFFFGTYLPHRTPPGGHTDVHNARSNPYPWLVSLLTCYHFGYHEEHHHYPHVPWWRLPQLRRRLENRRQAEGAGAAPNAAV
jgi:beta-carotene ketolase (CrtW type)